MDMKQLLDKLRPSAPLKIKRELWTVRVKNCKPVWEQKNIRKK